MANKKQTKKKTKKKGTFLDNRSIKIVNTLYNESHGEVIKLLDDITCDYLEKFEEGINSYVMNTEGIIENVKSDYVIVPLEKVNSGGELPKDLEETLKKEKPLIMQIMAKNPYLMDTVDSTVRELVSESGNLLKYKFDELAGESQYRMLYMLPKDLHKKMLGILLDRYLMLRRNRIKTFAEYATAILWDYIFEHIQYLEENIASKKQELFMNDFCDIVRNCTGESTDGEGIESTETPSREVKYTDSYKELNTLASECGYEHVRDNGDHGIFQNKDGNTVVIPQGRKIGKGLSLAIQKMLLGEKESRWNSSVEE